MDEEPVAARIEALAARLGLDDFVAACADLLAGADRTSHLDALVGLTRLSSEDLLLRERWRDYWLPTWGARGLLHVWPAGGGPTEATATEAVGVGLAHEHWRPVEMGLKVVGRHEVDGCADRAAALTQHPVVRVRAAAARALAVVGDTEHVAALRRLRDDDADPGCRRTAERAAAVMAERLDLPVDQDR